MLAIDSLTLQRGDKTLFKSFEAKFEAGKIVTVLGPNGSGKSTLLLAMTALFEPLHGSVSLKDKLIYEYSKHELSRSIAWQGDLPPAEFGLTVAQRLALSQDGANQDVIGHALNAMELPDLADRALGDLSSGERQRVEIAAIMVRDNPIWLMDEPTAHLDMRHQADCLKLMKKEAHQGRLIITVLHDLQQAAAVADIVVVLNGKGGIEVGLAEEMLVAEKLEPVFKIKLKGKGRDLMPVYSGEVDEEA